LAPALDRDLAVLDLERVEGAVGAARQDVRVLDEAPVRAHRPGRDRWEGRDEHEEKERREETHPIRVLSRTTRCQFERHRMTRLAGGHSCQGSTTIACSDSARDDVPTRSTYSPGYTTHSPSAVLQVAKLDESRTILTRLRFPGRA